MAGMSARDTPITAAEELALFVESTVDYAMFLLDPSGKVATWNRGAERIKGYTADEIVGQHFSAFYADEDRAADKPGEALAVAARDGRVEDEGWRIRKDGSRFWANVVITAMRAEDGALRGFGKVTRDLTRRRAHDAAARRREIDRAARAAGVRREVWLENTLRSIGDAVMATDAEGRVVFMNPVAEALTAWTEAEATGVALREVFHIVNEHTRAVVESPVDRVLREGVVVGLANHTVLIAKDGTERPIDDSGAPIRHGEEGLVGVVLVFRDITARKAADEEIALGHDRMAFLAEVRS
jgi:PAS domain S-box-containing protein